MNITYLPCVTEEAGEVLQAIGKVQRFGADFYWAPQGMTNMEALALEVGNLFEVIDRLDLPSELIGKGILQKKKSLETYGPGVIGVSKLEGE